MEESITFDRSLGKWRVRYPFLQDPRIWRKQLQESAEDDGDY